MEILILGGTEFVSKSIAMSMIKKGYKTSILTRGNKEVDYPGIKEHYKCDRKNIKDLEETLNARSFDYILDISGYVLEDVKNIIDTLDLSKLKRYVFCSSGAVYEESKVALDEDAKRGLNKNWGDYGLGKLEIENYLLHLHKSTGFPVSIIRPAYIYGEHNNLYRESYIFERGEKGLEIPIPPRKEETQFLYIDDFIEVIDSCLKNDKTIGEAYNVTNPATYTWEDWVKTVGVAMNLDLRIIKLSSSYDYQPREYFPFRNCTYLLSIEKLISHGLYIPSTSLLDGLKKSYQWYKEYKPETFDKNMNKMDMVLVKEHK